MIGSPLQGPGVWASVMRELYFNFTAPVRFGDTLMAEAMVDSVTPERHLVNLSFVCRNQRAESVLNGTAAIKVLKEVVIE